MKVVSVKSLVNPAVKVIRFGRFPDHRGFFAEPFRKSDFQNHPELSFMKGVEFLQVNESYSRPHVMRGMHFQWNPYMGKLVRTVAGRMVDMVMDVRQGSPQYGQIFAYDMPASMSDDYAEWIWVPPGFAHGNFFTEPTQIIYFCSGEYSPGCEAGICPLAADLDWSLCEPRLKALFDEVVAAGALLSDKDRNGLTLAAWTADPRSAQFVYGRC